jgi:hypothetical protein
MDTDHNAVAALLAGMKTSTNIEKRSFVPKNDQLLGVQRVQDGST